MVKFYLKHSNQEVKIGDEINLDIPMETPFGMGVTKINKIKVTQNILKLLQEKDLVYTKDNITDEEFIAVYKPIFRKWARVHNHSLEDTISLLNYLIQVSPNAHKIMVLEAIAAKINVGKIDKGIRYYIDPFKNHISNLANDKSTTLPVFYSLKDANDAYRLLAPFLSE